MEIMNWFTWASSLLIVFIAYKFIAYYNNKHKKKVPPSPPLCFPIIGHLHMLKRPQIPLHQTLHEISTTYGEILLLKLGVRKVLLISSPTAVEECLVKNDTVFADRPDTLVGRLLHYNSTSIAFSPYNDHFRTLKRLLTQEVFSSTKIPLFSGIRQDECSLLIRDLYLEATTQDSAKVNLNQGFNDLGLNIMTRMTAGKRYYGKEVEDISQAKQFREIMREGSALSSADNPGDFLPMLKFMFGGLEKKMVAWMDKTDSFYQQLLDERKGGVKNGASKAIIDVLILAQKQDPVFFTNEVIKGMVMVLVLAGADTTAATIEWAMALLLNHPETMKKAQKEIDEVIGGHDRLLNEDDVSKLPYLQNIVNETLRLYPPTPLLLPHESSEDSCICGYHVPKGTMLMVSLWTIHRDPKIWIQPDKFVPERFDRDGKERESLYKHFFPFGLGRRACPGYAMGKRAVCLVLGSLLQCFHFGRVDLDMLDMSQATGLTMPKANPLEALCKVRPCMANLLAKQF